MNVFNVISLLGGLAMFLYGMRLMGGSLKESASGQLRQAMEKLTNTPVKGFLLGLVLTAVIQSSTATIVITSGLVGAGIITLRQSLGILVGANVGTTVTGQIIRLLDLNAGDVSILRFFQPSTLAPIALIIGIIILMNKRSKDSEHIGHIIIGFGILFSGLLSMTDAVSNLTESETVKQLFSNLHNPLIGYLVGAGVAFVLQSSSATIGILQAFSISGQLTFSSIYAVLVGIYLGDCVTTAIVCNIGAKPDAKRVGIVNILYNLCKSALILLSVTVLHRFGVLDSIWDEVIHSGGIADTNTVFNLVCALALLPATGLYEKLSRRIVRDEPASVSPADSRLDALNPVFFSTPGLAFNRCQDLLGEMYKISRTNISRAFSVIFNYDNNVINQINADENTLDSMADSLSNYLIQLSAHISTREHVSIMNQYYSVNTEFERLGDHATNLGEIAQAMHENGTEFSKAALAELAVLQELTDTILDYSSVAFGQMDIATARRIEPLEEVVDDMVGTLKNNHLARLREGKCSVIAGTSFLNILTEIERISDICSNVGIATIVRENPEIMNQVHDYISQLHSGRNEEFNEEYNKSHERYFRLLDSAMGVQEL